MCGSAWGWGMIMSMWLFWLLVILAVVWLVRRSGRTTNGGAGERGEGRAVEILKERYARGEIDADTYHRMLDDLRRPPPQ